MKIDEKIKFLFDHPGDHHDHPGDYPNHPGLYVGLQEYTRLSVRL